MNTEDRQIIISAHLTFHEIKCFREFPANRIIWWWKKINTSIINTRMIEIHDIQVINLSINVTVLKTNAIKNIAVVSCIQMSFVLLDFAVQIVSRLKISFSLKLKSQSQLKPIILMGAYARI